MYPYNDIFCRAESTLIRVGSKNLSADIIRKNLDHFKYLEDKTFTDADYYWILVCVVFYSGFRASTVNAKLDLIRKYFPDYETVAKYGSEDIAKILDDGNMIRNKRKIQACIENARTFRSIVHQYGSFDKYIETFFPKESFENLMLLKEELEYRFKGLGRVTTYHVLTDIGMPVVKPDRVICGIFNRLGLIESNEQYLKTIIHGRKFAQATGYPIRYIDIVFVAYGQSKSEEFGLESGICLEKNPLCHLCKLQDNCNFYTSNLPGI
jgi:DNA-3-methyladenine glycosylase I